MILFGNILRGMWGGCEFSHTHPSSPFNYIQPSHRVQRVFPPFIRCQMGSSMYPTPFPSFHEHRLSTPETPPCQKWLEGSQGDSRPKENIVPRNHDAKCQAQKLTDFNVSSFLIEGLVDHSLHGQKKMRGCTILSLELWGDKKSAMSCFLMEAEDWGQLDFYFSL